MKAPVFGIAGFKNAGKTTLTARLVTELSGRGYLVSTVKHAHHTFDIDQPGRDSFIHRKAGAHETAVVSINLWAVMHDLRGAEEPPLSDILGRMSDCDLVLTEGYKMEPHPKIEVRRPHLGHPELAGVDPSIVAIATDEPALAAEVPVLDIDDVAAIADFVIAHSGAKMAAR